MDEIVVAQMIAMRAQIGSLQAQFEALSTVIQAMQSEPPAESGCPHLETENVGTFGQPEQRCTVCKALVG